MKYLNDYIEEKREKLFADTGAFFAFGQKQFEEKRKPGVKYVNLKMGLVCPKENVKRFFEAWDKIHEDGVKADMQENGKKAIIERELFNHECQITYDYSDVTAKLSNYPITEAEIAAEFPGFMNLCREKDYF